MAYKTQYYTTGSSVEERRKKADEYANYNESADVGRYRQEYENQLQNRPADWTGGTYGDQLKSLADQISNRGKFSYDLNGDALYQQYKNQYVNLGKMAMIDTLAQASALTGGYGNSYASTAGNQAYQSYLQGLNDKVPELYQLALDKYNMEGQDLYNQANLYGNMYNTEYGEYRDRVGDWNNELDRYYNRYLNERDYDYGRFSDDRSYYTGLYQDERDYDYKVWADAQDREMAAYQLNHKSSGGGGSRSSGSGGNKSPTSAMMQKALEAYNSGGEDALYQYLDSLAGYNITAIEDYVAKYGKYNKPSSGSNTGHGNQGQRDKGDGDYRYRTTNYMY